MISLTVLSLCLTAVFAVPFEGNQLSPRIVNGNPASKGQFPYQAYVNVRRANKADLMCSGAIIGRKWIVTTARCIIGAKNATIKVGSNVLVGADAKRYTTYSTRFVIHDGYDDASWKNDIGLVQTHNYLYYVSGSTVGALNLPKSDVAVGASVVVSGWGVTRDQSKQPSNDLLFAPLSVISNKQCTSVYTEAIITNDILCANYTASTVRGICAGDIGAPLVANASTKPILVGLGNFFSGRERGCERGEPSGFTRVYPFVSWIKKVAGL